MSGALKPMRGGAYFTTLTRRPRLLVGLGLGMIAYVLTPSALREATRALIGFDVGAGVFLALIARMMLATTGEDVRDHARQEDEKPVVLLVVAVLAASFAIAAVLWELGPVKDMTGWIKGAHLALVAFTVLAAWAFTHTMFALHYAAQFYAADGGGFAFPDCEKPGWAEFCYEAFTIGCACATADVNITSRNVRVTVLVQSVIAFFFNTIVLALTINIAAGLV